MAVNVMNAVFWDMMPCGSCKNRRFGGMSVLKRATFCHVPEEGILLESFYIRE
jgi:hypothetical protein